MEKLFGTDGIRGRADEFPLDDTVYEIGASLARHFETRLGRLPRFITGRDTRESGPRIEITLSAGAQSAGALTESAGVFTTPGIAFLTAHGGFDAGIVISASHNPFEDNGIKIFSPSGRKIDEALEAAIEADIMNAARTEGVRSGTSGDAHLGEFRRAYLEHVRKAADIGSLYGRKIVLDCANGAASNLAPECFASLGAETVVINAEPDGRNINRDCGSLHLAGLQEKVLSEKADFGVAFDGDADRALFVDELGQVVDGDVTLFIMARYLKETGGLANSTVVATVMSNLGLEKAFDEAGIKLERTSVGDKYVLERLLETGSELGGEQSGHIIFPMISLVGDGMLTALLLAKASRHLATTLSEAADGFTAYPQKLVGVKVREKRPFDETPEIAAAAAAAEQRLADRGRLLLRYSGTENLARIMIEADTRETVERETDALAEVIERNLGLRD